MQALALPLEKLISQVKDNANTLFFSALVFSYHVLQSKFPCSCEPQSDYCKVYITLPCFIVTILMLSTDLLFQKAWRYTTSECSCHFGCLLLRRLVKASCVGLLWAASVLIDAEWYVCCENPNPRELARLQCKAKQEITTGETPVTTIAEMKTNSRMYGISLLFAITFVGAFLLSAWTIFTYTLPWKCCNREVLVHELILEVGEDVLSETMKERQKTMLSEKIEDYITKGDWKKCLDIVSDFIEATGKHQNTSPKRNGYCSPEDNDSEEEQDSRL